MLKKILFVDESRSLYDDLKSVFTKEISAKEYEIIGCQSGEQALEIINKNKIDLLITELNFSNAILGGWDLIQIMREKKILIKTIVLASYVSHESRLRALKEKVISIFEKPILWADLKPYLKYLLSFQSEIDSENEIKVDNFPAICEAITRWPPHLKFELVERVLNLLDDQYLEQIDPKKYKKKYRKQAKLKSQLIEKQKKGEIDLKVNLEKIENFSVSQRFVNQAGPYYTIHYWQDGKTQNLYLGRLTLEED